MKFVDCLGNWNGLNTNSQSQKRCKELYEKCRTALASSRDAHAMEVPQEEGSFPSLEGIQADNEEGTVDYNQVNVFPNSVTNSEGYATPSSWPTSISSFHFFRV